ncbi:MAG: oxidoreductase [Candidatus Sphingomonas phytovorans]|nr:oxidoreductase [Sphingomonas sp.]WEK02243.1 MAG: oxidoreductase [Sphingomonas sp.]
MTMRTWLVTGSSRGLGRALCEAILDAGDQLVATARSVAPLRDLLERAPDRCAVFALDVNNIAAVRAAMTFATGRFGRLDVVVNNAGYGNIAPIEDLAEDDFRAQIETNFFGTVNVTRAAVPLFRAQRSGHFVQISSIGGRAGAPGLGAYQAAKWAVEGFSEVLAAEVKPLGVKVTIVEPGGFRTDWAGASMTVPDIRADYDETVGGLARYLRATTGKEQGDPVKAAAAILTIVEAEDPPLRLLLGSSAVQIAERVDRERRECDLAWRALSRSTDFDAEIGALRSVEA